jgi:hypothetical protein
MTNGRTLGARVLIRNKNRDCGELFNTESQERLVILLDIFPPSAIIPSEIISSILLFGRKA